MISVPTTNFSSFKRILVLCAAAAALAACSSDYQRLSEYPGVEKTASLPDKTGSAGTVSSRTLDDDQPTNVRPSWQTGYSAGTRTPSSDVSAGAPGTVVVQQGQTLYSIARSNGMTTSQLAAANNIPAPYSLRVGQRLMLPGVGNLVSPAPRFQPQTITAANAPATSRNYAAGGVHQVNAGETLFAIGRTYKVHPYKIAAHNNLAKPYSLSVGQRLRIPGKDRSTAWTDTPSTAPETKAVDQPSRTGNTVSKSSVVSQEISRPVDAVEQPIAKTQDRLTGGNAQFRWPIRGRIISTYGPKPGGSRNEGINIAVPEGASVRASEAGVVAYAGNELKGYGNLILVRHEGSWVSAYAHNKELLVKRGDTVRRGEIIARAGQTGSVTSPQLHFELRKGASAVNPLKYMSTTTASY